MDVDTDAVSARLAERHDAAELQDAAEAFCLGQDVVLVGGSELGKSELALDIAAHLQKGFLLVAHPLRAHIQAQKLQCLQRGIPVLHFSSTKPWAATGSGPFYNAERSVMMNALANPGQPLKILFISLDRLADPEVLSALARALVDGRLKGIVFDDAQYFLPQVQGYRKAIDRLHGGNMLRVRFPTVPILAMASPATLLDVNSIVARLGLKNALAFRLGLSKRNIALEVRTLPNMEAKVRDLRDLLRTHATRNELKPGVIFCRLNATCDSVAQLVRQLGFRAQPFHASLDMGRRNDLLLDFLGNRVILVSSVALGIGVHHPGLRWVVHWDLPSNKYGLYSEVSRAGRDGQPATSVLYATQTDLHQLASWHSGENSAGAADLGDYAFDATCRKEALWGEVCQAGDEQCDLCRPAPASGDTNSLPDLSRLAVSRRAL